METLRHLEKPVLTPSDDFKRMARLINESNDTSLPPDQIKKLRRGVRVIGRKIIGFYHDGSPADITRLKYNISQLFLLRPDLVKDVYKTFRGIRFVKASVIRELLDLPSHGPIHTRKNTY